MRLLAPALVSGEQDAATSRHAELFFALEPQRYRCLTLDLDHLGG
jgi:hypothetical protein